MSKKARIKAKNAAAGKSRHRLLDGRGLLQKRAVIGVLALSLCLMGAGLTVMGGLGSGVRGWFAPAPVPTPDNFGSANPAKEYVYAGGRLAATEEPAMVMPPAGLVATGVSAAQVTVTWTAAPGTIDHYQVERTTNIGTSYGVVAPTVTGLTFSDTAVSNGTAYLYRVCAVDGGGRHSAYTNLDVATAITFTDDPLAASTTNIKAQHIYDLRQAVNAIRVTAGLAAASWSDPTLSGVTIKAAHFQELRNNLDQALTALGLPAGSYTDSSLSGVVIKKAHVDEIRQRVR
jgi:hypothetical protein